MNLSPSQLREGRAFARRIAGVLDSTGFDPASLELELTESQLVQQLESNSDALRLISDLGVRLIVDDFGMGYSSLGYLKRLPIHGLKVDRGFVRDIVTDAHDAAIVRAIISLAQGLKLGVTAEGVETGEQLDRLRGLACDRWQGFLLSPAVEASPSSRRSFSDRDRARVARTAQPGLRQVRVAVGFVARVALRDPGPSLRRRRSPGRAPRPGAVVTRGSRGSPPRGASCPRGIRGRPRRPSRCTTPCRRRRTC